LFIVFIIKLFCILISESWQNIIDKCIINKTLQIREAAVAALSCLCIAYYDHANYYELNNFILDKYIKGSDNDLEEHIRIGYVSAIGNFY